MANEKELGLFIKSIIDSVISEIGNMFEQEICKLKIEEDTQLSKGYNMALKDSCFVVNRLIQNKLLITEPLAKEQNDEQ